MRATYYKGSIHASYLVAQGLNSGSADIFYFHCWVCGQYWDLVLSNGFHKYSDVLQKVHTVTVFLLRKGILMKCDDLHIDTNVMSANQRVSTVWSCQRLAATTKRFLIWLIGYLVNSIPFKQALENIKLLCQSSLTAKPPHFFNLKIENDKKILFVLGLLNLASLTQGRFSSVPRLARIASKFLYDYPGSEK